MILISLHVSCDECGGKGKIQKSTCPHCGGTKVETAEEHLTIIVERGMPDGHIIVRKHLCFLYILFSVALLLFGTISETLIICSFWHSLFLLSFVTSTLCLTFLSHTVV